MNFDNRNNTSFTDAMLLIAIICIVLFAESTIEFILKFFGV